MNPFPPRDRFRIASLLPALLLACSVFLGACATAPDAPLQPFGTDGCSMFPDRSQISHKDWCHCCVMHDLAYWRGGTEKDRADADWQLRGCVLQSTSNEGLADLMFAGVRAGGGPYFHTSYRWGYGWPYARGYRELSPDERAAADALQSNYLRDHPGLSCPSQ